MMQKTKNKKIKREGGLIERQRLPRHLSLVKTDATTTFTTAEHIAHSDPAHTFLQTARLRFDLTSNSFH